MEDQWEFIPIKVPEGISLRNFGIQVVSRRPCFLLLDTQLLTANSCHTV